SRRPRPSVKVDVDEEGTGAGEKGEGRDASGRCDAEWSDAEQDAGSGQREHPGAEVLPTGREDREGRVGEELFGVGGTQDGVPADRATSRTDRHDDDDKG